MSSHWTYLLIDLGTISIPFIFSFHPKLRFDKTWHAFFPAMLIVGGIFIGWDVIFTAQGVWGFNPDYLTGITWINLPLEEWLFFVCIPYACVFTYHCFGRLISWKQDPQRTPQWIAIALLMGLALLALLNAHRIYTSVTFTLLAITLGFIVWKLKPQWLGRFLFSYTVLLIPFAIVNGLLTGTALESPVVWYNDAENMGIRLGTIPVEDIFYGMLLILGNVLIYEHLLHRRSVR